MAEIRSVQDFLAELKASGSSGAVGASLVSGGPDQPPSFERRVKWIKSTVEPTGQYESCKWFNPDTGIEVTWVITASGGKWVELGPAGYGQPGEAGPGVPAGGSAGQVLGKIDGTDFNTGWTNRVAGTVTLTVGPTAPSSPSEYDIWVDTTGLV